LRSDLVTALDRLAPVDAGWVRGQRARRHAGACETMLTGVSLAVPVMAGRLDLGPWQGIYLAEHRERPHRREIVLQFLGSGPDRAAVHSSSASPAGQRKCGIGGRLVGRFLQPLGRPLVG
jgi:hypothetical protein